MIKFFCFAIWTACGVYSVLYNTITHCTISGGYLDKLPVVYVSNSRIYIVYPYILKLAFYQLYKFCIYLYILPVFYFINWGISICHWSFNLVIIGFVVFIWISYKLFDLPIVEFFGIYLYMIYFYRFQNLYVLGLLVVQFTNCRISCVYMIQDIGCYQCNFCIR